MNSILSIEWLKIKKYTTFWVLLGLFLLFLPSFYFGITYGVLNIAPGADLLTGGRSFEKIWANVCFYASFFVIFISILIIILVTNEYTYRTNRQNIIDGWTKMKFLNAKWGIVLVLSLFTVIYTFVIGLVNGLIEGSSFSGISVNFGRLGLLFILSVNYYGFALLFAVLLKRSGLAIGLLILYYMIVETMITGFLKYLKYDYADLFLPLQSSDDMLPLGAMKDIAKATGHGGVEIPIQYYIIASVCWIALYYIISRYRLLKRDW